jgi:hypothetical protein
MRSWKIWLRKYIIHVVGRIFVEGAFTPSVNLETVGNVRSAMKELLAKQLKKQFKKR